MDDEIDDVSDIKPKSKKIAGIRMDGIGIVTSKHAQWIEDVRSQTRSGLSVEDWCAANDHRVDVFNGRLRKLKLMGHREEVVRYGPRPGVPFATTPDHPPAPFRPPPPPESASSGSKRRMGGVWVADPFARLSCLGDLRKLVDEYFEDVDSRMRDGRWSSNKLGRTKDGSDGGRTGAPYSVAGLAAWLGMSMRQYSILRSDVKYEWCHEYLGWVEAKMEARMLEGAMSGDYFGSAFDLTMKNRFGYADKMDTTNRRMSINVKVVEVRDRKTLELYEKGGVDGIKEGAGMLGDGGAEVVEVVLAGNGKEDAS